MAQKRWGVFVYYTCFGFRDLPWLLDSVKVLGVPAGGVSHVVACWQPLGCCCPGWMWAADIFLGVLSPDRVAFGLSASASEEAVYGWAYGSSMSCFHF